MAGGKPQGGKPDSSQNTTTGGGVGMMGTGGATKTQADMSTHGGPGIGGGLGGVNPGTSGMQMAGGDY